MASNTITDRPTAAELETARTLIARVKAADSSIKKADELLVCAAIAFRAGEFATPTASTRAMGKEISRPKLVSDWVDRLAKLDQICESPAGGGLLVQPEWWAEQLPGISDVKAGPLQISPGKTHGKRTISAVSTTPLGSTRQTEALVEYTLPPAEGEPQSASKRRDGRHWHREESKLRSLDLSGAAEARAAREAERQRLVREREREVRDVLDRLILRVERSIIRERLQQTRPRAPWRCPAGCKLDDLSCARLRFRQQCVPWRPSIQKQQRQLWDQEHLTQGDFVSELGNRYHSKMQCHLHAVEDQRAQAWRPSFEISDSEVAEIQQAFISSWDGKVEPLV